MVTRAIRDLIALITSTGKVNSTRLRLVQLVALPLLVTRAINLLTILLIIPITHSKESSCTHFEQKKSQSVAYVSYKVMLPTLF